MVLFELSNVDEEIISHFVDFDEQFCTFSVYEVHLELVYFCVIFMIVNVIQQNKVLLLQQRSNFEKLVFNYFLREGWRFVGNTCIFFVILALIRLLLMLMCYFIASKLSL